MGLLAVTGDTQLAQKVGPPCRTFRPPLHLPRESRGTREIEQESDYEIKVLPGVTEMTYFRCRASPAIAGSPPMTKFRGVPVKTRLPVTAWIFAALGVFFSLLYALIGGHGVGEVIGEVHANMTHLLGF